MTGSEATPAELLAMAEQVATVPRPEFRGAWPRAGALLARQALEAAVEELWDDRTQSMARRVSMRAKMLCLGVYVEGDIAEDVAYTWAALSRACHHHPYDLAPTGSELQSLLGTVETLITSLSEAAT